MRTLNMEHTFVNLLGNDGYALVGTLFFLAMTAMLYREAVRK
jgi:hypothetical protein